MGVTCFDCSERIDVKEDFSPAADVSDAIDGTDEGAVAFLPRLLNDELIIGVVAIRQIVVVVITSLTIIAVEF